MQPVALFDHSDPPLPPQGMVREQFHRRYFAEAAAAAARFGVTFPRLMQHLEQQAAFLETAGRTEVRYLDDLLHVIACIDGDGRAWGDLQERYDQFLIRRCTHRGGAVDAALAVGRLFVELRRLAALPQSDNPFSLWTYTGASPLRSWLADRLGRIQRATSHASVTTAADRSSSAATPTVRVRTTSINLAPPMSPSGRMSFRSGASECPPLPFAGHLHVGPAMPVTERSGA